LNNLLPAYATWQRFNPHLFLNYVLIHASLLIAPFTFSWLGLSAFLIIYFTTICLGITLGYHRLLTHCSYKTYPWVRFILALCGVLACQRGPIWWTAAHRMHHSKVDKPMDPHTPTVSFIWSHALWAFFRHPQLDDSIETVHRLARDLREEPGMRFLEKYYGLINAVFMAGLFSLGYALGGFKLGLSLFVWGGIFRVLVTLHITWMVNSVCHLWGYRNYKTADTSRNNWIAALLTFGEGWHNNHHADQRAARNGHRWYEIDVTYYLILLMRQTKLAYNVMPVSNRLLNAEYLEIRPTSVLSYQTQLR